MNQSNYTNKSFRIIGLGGIGLTIIGAGALIDSPGVTWWTSILIGLVAVSLCVLSWKIYVVPRVVISDRRVRVSNPFRTHEVGFEAISAIEAGQHLVLRLHSGEAIRVWCIQAANASLMLGRRSHVERVAEEVRALIAQEAGSSATGVEVVNKTDSLRPLAMLAAVGALAGLLLRLASR